MTDSSLDIVSAPILNSVLVIGSFLFLGLLTAVAVQKPLRMVGGKADFQQTFVASAWIAIYYYPILIAVDGILGLISPSAQIPDLTYALALAVESVAVLARLHRISIMRALPVIVLSQVVLGIALGLCIAIVRGLMNGA